MKRATLYSRSHRPSLAARTAPAVSPDSPTPVNPKSFGARLQRFRTRRARPLSFAASALVTLAIVAAFSAVTAPRKLTQRDIDAAVLHTLEKQKQPPSNASIAYDAIRPSVVRVNQVGLEESGDTEKAVGTGVVIEESGIILTNIHVVAGAERISVTFSNGTTSDAHVVSVQPEDDLAVLKAHTVPDDLKPATLRSTRGLRLGDEVIAVGHPFGIGPSVSSGIVSGLRREYVTPKGKKVMSNLIQFDAAANPGNSGGPLVTADGEVVGIVTAILNPTEQRVFIGIGFAVPIENAASAVGMSPF
ncbi:MAG: trypsin-like peptidase domain-containing protein [Rhodospirillaceae bacterium]|nr:trypsin-like peptidase domain-containing protein [Rhodospirillaceae bacterium]